LASGDGRPDRELIAGAPISSAWAQMAAGRAFAGCDLIKDTKGKLFDKLNEGKTVCGHRRFLTATKSSSITVNGDGSSGPLLSG
jgi:hypothetical protein